MPSIEPLMPPSGDQTLEDLAASVIAKSSALASQLNAAVADSIGDLVRSMNCYYSNLIEGHDTSPRDIERALASDYSSDAHRRVLQFEARAHIEVQRMIDFGEAPQVPACSLSYLQWLHHEFCSRLPEEFLWITNPDTGERLRVVPGELRRVPVSVGRYIPPKPDYLDALLARFSEGYTSPTLSRISQIIAAGAAHHRILWIHPFLDGNGRVARLLSYAMLKQAGVGSSLWSVARGLARNVERYRNALADADSPRRGDFDGRGALSLAALKEFCVFFLNVCDDQLTFMHSLLQPGQLLRRMKIYVDEEVESGRLARGSMGLLREVFLTGEIERGRAAELTGYQERRARDVLSGLLGAGLLISATPKGPVRMGFPVDVLERWLPRLYPGDVTDAR
jgi:Fic family protein